MIKPPIGLIPPGYSNEYRTRFQNVGRAIDRYLHHSEFIKIPIDWINEYNNLCDILKNNSLRTSYNSNKEIKRYDPELLPIDGINQPIMEEYSDGEYVKYDDIKHLLQINTSADYVNQKITSYNSDYTPLTLNRIN
jgi:hypothetical protein